MPILHIDTNIIRSIVSFDFGIKTCQLMADMFNSPLKVSQSNILPIKCIIK